MSTTADAATGIGRTRVGAVLAIILGLVGVAIALALPFMPVTATETTVTWPIPGQPASSTTALFVPYRPAELTATVPCTAVQAVDGARSSTVVATGPEGDGLVLKNGPQGAELLLGHRSLPLGHGAAGRDCGITVRATSDGVTISDGAGQVIDLPGEPVPQVFGFRTDLDPVAAAGMTVVARTASAFATRPTTAKAFLVAVHLVAVVTAFGLLTHTGRRGGARVRYTGESRRAPRSRTTWVDVAVVALLLGWAVIGPMSVDDGWATTIARTYAETGNAGNYYRWWNASETPFAFSQQLLAALTRVSLQPVWLRLPSTLLAVGTWFMLTRGVLRAALPVVADTTRIRLLTAIVFLLAWLPFNLGVRPESYVAFGLTAVLGLMWGARGPVALGWTALVIGLTVPISPTSCVLAAPVAAFAFRAITVLRRTAPTRLDLLARVVLLVCVASVGLSVVFADQTADGVITATDWHAFFGPSFPWHDEPDRYRYLLGEGQQGSFAKRSPILLALALLPVVGMLFARRGARGDELRSAARLAGVVVMALALLSLVPSKWSYHLGALAGLLASFMAVALAALVIQPGKPAAHRSTVVVAMVGGGLVVAASSLAFAGTNAWWLPEVADVPWAAGPVRPFGVPLDNAAVWVGVWVLAVATLTVIFARRHTAVTIRALTAGPATVTVLAAATALLVLVSSFVAAPIRRQSGSLATANLRWLAGYHSCGIADDIEVLRDDEPLGRASIFGNLDGFVALGGFDRDWPPPDPPGFGTAIDLWGSLVGSRPRTATMTSPWFMLAPLGSAEGLSVSVSGRTGGANELVFEFGRSTGDGRVGAALDGVTVLADVVPTDRSVPADGPERWLWKTVTVDAAQVPQGANRVRIRARDAERGSFAGLALTGPRRHTVMSLTDFLAGHGPVLESWPQSFLFPCVHDIAGVVDGLAQTPQTLVVAPGPWFTQPTDQQIGGVFAGLVPYGGLHEVTTRLAGHPDIHWGTLLLVSEWARQDAYRRRNVDIQRFGHEEGRREYQAELPR